MKKHIVLAVIATAAMALTLVGCGVKITNIAVPESAMVEKGESITLPVVYGTDDAPAVTPETAATGESAETDEKLAKAASKLTVEWTSSDESVATVDATGMVVAVSAGEADITASVTDSEMSAVCKVTVKVAAKDITVPDNLDVKLNDGNETTVEATVSPADATDVKVSYASTDEAVATVDKDGRVQVLQPGECDITTTLMQDGEKVTEKTTHVKAFYEVESITLDSNEGKLTVGNSHTIKATVAPEEVAAETTIEWSSSNEKVATVDENGKVTAIAAGEATITATVGEKSANYEVTVEQPKKVTTSNKTYKSSSSSNSSAAVTPSNPAPVVPAPAQPDPAPAQPDPQPEQPAQDSQPSGGTDNSGGNSEDDWWHGPVLSAPTDNGCTQEEIDAGGC
ncbi:MAG: Ig domain-containing protein [Subdoligranulum sp.]|jgi:Ig domain protein group 2 domain protein